MFFMFLYVLGDSWSPFLGWWVTISGLPATISRPLNGDRRVTISSNGKLKLFVCFGPRLP